MGYEKRRNWSDKFIPTIKRIVGPYLLEESSFEVDTQNAADLVVISAKSITIAARVRRARYYENKRYRNQFTIRSVSNGHKTELQKITDGWADWMFYGFASSDNDNDNSINHWRIIDLNVCRSAWIRRKNHVAEKASNGDGTGFVAFDINSFPKELIIASSADIDRDYITLCEPMSHLELAYLL